MIPNASRSDSRVASVGYVVSTVYPPDLITYKRNSYIFLPILV